MCVCVRVLATPSMQTDAIPISTCAGPSIPLSTGWSGVLVTAVQMFTSCLGNLWQGEFVVTAVHSATPHPLRVVVGDETAFFVVSAPTGTSVSTGSRVS